MNYPVWQLGALGGGFWIALIAVLHVFVAHFAVGGGFFLVLTEARARRSGSRAILDYARKFSRFFLLLTMVFGALSGVGIWLTISVLSPAATVLLVRTFVWAWATEWTFFAGEIVAILVYYYSFERLTARRHMAVGWMYCAFAWLSLFFINGILGFMLTPGDWAVSHDFWDGFFNPSFWPSLVFRTSLALMLAGLFGFATALGIRDVLARESMLRAACRWAVLSLPVLAASGWWYVTVLPQPVREFVLRRSTEIASSRQAFPLLLLAVAATALALLTRLPLAARRVLAGLLLVLGLGVVGTFETMREAARKPWLVHGQIWSTDISPAAAAPGDAPLLPRAAWAKVREVTPENRLEAGRDLYTLQCLACHSVGGPMKDIRNYTGRTGTVGVTAFLTGQGKLFTHMPPFLGSPAERDALAAHITADLNGRSLEPPKPVAVEPADVEVPAFAADTAPYLLLAWNTLGVVAMTDCNGSFSLLPPGNTLQAVLVRRDVLPEVVTENIEVSYAAPDGFKKPSVRLDFWKYAPSLLGEPLPPDVLASGHGPDGTMQAGDKLFGVQGVPASPYPETGVNHYPVFNITAKDAATGQTVAATKAVAPVATEMGCFNCHGGSWRVDGATGIARDTAQAILVVHDKRNHTDLAAKAAAGQPVACQSCHPDPGFEAAGRPELLNLSAAIHGFHAAYMTGQGEEACSRCHPTAKNGITQAQRDNHAASELGCPRCHGFLEDHALSLLAAEQEAGKKAAAWLMGPLAPRSAPDVAAVRPRTPWVQEPDCLTCHKDFTRPDPATATAFNTWTKDASGLFRNRKEDTGNIPCAACHGSPHATFPAVNDYGLDVNNLAPLQYMGAPAPVGSAKRCDVCHTIEMDGEPHHPNMVK